mmetsp:Transcript_33326/g.32396  ORF Transcript_33326/g.32396 Transcript_33326/m.32396 type:complete len:108 (+) Transcript_33326:145-468(+)
MMEGEDFVSKWVEQSQYLQKENKELSDSYEKKQKKYKELKEKNETYQSKYNNIDIGVMHSKMQFMKTENNNLKATNQQLMKKLEKMNCLAISLMRTPNSESDKIGLC